jgi:hypothetical protein
VSKLKLRTLLKTSIKTLFILVVVWVFLKPFMPGDKFNTWSLNDFIQLESLSFVVLIPIFCLSILNIILETFKWKSAAHQCENIGNKTALYSVLAGIAVSNIFPWKTGDFIGKISFLKSENKIRGAYLSVYASMTQYLITIITGLLFLGFFKEFLKVEPLNLSEKSRMMWSYAVITLLLLIGFIFLFKDKIWLILYKISGPRTRYYLKNGKSIPLNLTLKLIAISALRYATFILPYWILILYADSSVDLIKLTAGLSIVFFLQSFMPGYLLSDLPLKGLLHINILASVVSETFIIGNAVLVVFIFNQIIPSICGAFILIFARTK